MLRSASRRRGIALLNQQCWLWGRDTVRAEGNLLLDYGFSRRLSDPEGTSSTQYTLICHGGEEAEQAVVRLWGFGFFYGISGRTPPRVGTGLFLNRFRFVPRMVAEITEFAQAHEMEKLHRAADLLLLPAALRWIARYERWVLGRCGLSYRQRCLATWKKTKLPPEEMAEAWLRLAQEIVASHARHQP